MWVDPRCWDLCLGACLPSWLLSLGQRPIVCWVPEANSPTGGVLILAPVLARQQKWPLGCPWSRLPWLPLWPVAPWYPRSLPGCCCLYTARCSHSLHANSQLYPVFSVNVPTRTLTFPCMHKSTTSIHRQHIHMHTLRYSQQNGVLLTVKLFPMFVSLLPLLLHLLSCFVVVIVLSIPPPLFPTHLLTPPINSFHILSQWLVQSFHSTQSAVNN